MFKYAFQPKTCFGNKIIEQFPQFYTTDIDFLKKELGDYELNNKDGFKKYISKDDNIDKSFEYTTDKKWIK